MRSCALFLFFLFPAITLAGEVPVLAPVVAVGSPTEALQEDPVLPATRAPFDTPAATGSVVEQIAEATALPVQQTGQAGNRAQFQGLGLNPADTNVQAFGVPLNPPEGTGVNFPFLPQFLWSSFRFQAGPAPGSFDPQAVSGSLILTPWTEAALRGEAGPGTRATQFYSGADLFQMSIGARSPGRVATLLGFSEGKAKGPAGSVSARWALNSRQELRFHRWPRASTPKAPDPTEPARARASCWPARSRCFSSTPAWATRAG